MNILFTKFSYRQTFFDADKNFDDVRAFGSADMVNTLENEKEKEEG